MNNDQAVDALLACRPLCCSESLYHAMARTNPAEYVRQVRQEVSKVTWPTRKETAITTAMVFVFVTIMALFFLVVDQISAVAIQFILGVGG